MIVTAIALGALLWIVTDEDPSAVDTASLDLSVCSLPAVSRWDLRPDPNNDLATNRTPCEALPQGLILACEDGSPRESIMDCDDIQAYFAP